MSQYFTLLGRRAVIAIALSLQFLIPAPVFAGPSDHGNDSHTEASTGPNGGEITEDGSDAIEVSLVEEGESARLKVWAATGGKPVRPADLKATATLKRPNGEEVTLTLKPSSAALISDQVIPEPHFFEVTINVSLPGRDGPVHAEFHKAEGLLALTPEQVSAAGIITSEAKSERLESSTRFPGEIRFNADRTAHVVPKAAGTVQQVSADLGQEVKKGQLLAVISSASLSELRSEWLAATKRRNLAAATHARELKLWREQVSAQQDYQQAQTVLQEADIAVQNAVQKLRAVGAEPSAKDLSLLEIRAPFDGVIVEKHIALGEALTDASSIFTISDLSTVWAEFVIAPKDLQTVRVGEDAKVTSTSFAEEASGTVSYIGALLGQQTRTATARVTLKNPDMAWRPGLFVSVNVVVERNEVGVAVESDAIQDVNGQPTVFVEVPGGFLPQPVKIGATTEKSSEVISGLRAGTRYVSSNAFVLKSELGKATADHAH
ncbi:MULTISPECIES: efflux RND transporter periplasmic adaptor subunit [Achromobacter]|nr:MULTISPECIES: efflux RND transporter periplasmic adaptor subunit [Achromobacter]SPT41718.1 Cation efflux system protein CzcB [Achromobacter denitrificans]MDH0735456.1 efflux RND transporter periplasmic adaptor subunit [Achromobacter spanius]CAB3641529.1 Cobalt-zinc-cadmium resistance protein CzcB [Achromobacter spanius]CAB3943331.1 Cobalt-zinc-cadmium resistance protein CzcB [Achromobacter piechaudii]VEE56432.1 Cation efflux system protein CzcB [Achromobacter spanius]